MSLDPCPWRQILYFPSDVIQWLVADTLYSVIIINVLRVNITTRPSWGDLPCVIFCDLISFVLQAMCTVSITTCYGCLSMVASLQSQTTSSLEIMLTGIQKIKFKYTNTPNIQNANERKYYFEGKLKNLYFKVLKKFTSKLAIHFLCKMWSMISC